MTRNKGLGIVVCVVVAGLAAGLWMQQDSLNQIRAENESLRKRLAEISSENESLSAAAAKAGQSSGLSREQLAELLKLRGQVGVLRKQAEDADKLRRENQQLRETSRKPVATPAADSDPAREEQKRTGIAKLTDAKYVTLALFLHAEENNGIFPTTLDEISARLRKLSADSGTPMTWTNQFELVMAGSREAIKNPASTILVREREAWPAPNGGWLKTYGFADGHSEIHKSDTGDFTAWEAERMLPEAAK
jgi:hypothetical protein